MQRPGLAAQLLNQVAAAGAAIAASYSRVWRAEEPPLPDQADTTSAPREPELSEPEHSRRHAAPHDAATRRSTGPQR